MYLTLNSDHTGSFEYESPVSYSTAYFRWSVSGNKITCKGAYANTYGDVDADFTISFEIRGDRLYPLDRFTEFILTQDGSVITDGNGNIISGGVEEEPSIPNVSDTAERERIENFIKSNIKISLSYSDYHFSIQIESTLENVLSDKDIKYGVGHGDVNGDEYVSIENQLYYFSKNQSDGVTKVNIKNPFWSYFSWGIEPNDNDSWAKCEIYYGSYKNLSAKNWSSLDYYEIELYNNLVEYLSKYESKAVYSYEPTIKIMIDNKYYELCRVC